MCILLKLNYAKCSVSDLFFSNVIEERSLGARPPGTGRVNSNDALHPGGHTSISLTGMLVREQISTTQKNRMTINLNPQKLECPKIQ